MRLVIQKYGGTSVGNVARIRAVAERVRFTRQQGYDVVVVVSAMAGETDRLVQLAQTIAVTPTPRELDLLLATGEMVSVALVAMALQEVGCQAEALTGMQAGIVTDETHTAACITHLVPTRVRQALAAGVVPVVAGFQGISHTQDITTLGRGGSDLTAVALAAALQADFCEIYTDVDGVYSADPRKVLHAQRLEWISYEDMLVMAGAGAKVLQARAVECAWQYGVPVVVKSSFTEGGGTLVSHAETAADIQHWAA
jgi:aspartate kinase